VITRADLADDLDKTVAAVRQFDTRAPILTASTRISRISRLHDLFSASRSSAAHPDTSAPFIFCGIGNPKGFRRQLEAAGFAMAGFHAFGDHYRYRRRDIDWLENEAAARSAKWLLTTVKDAMKLEGLEQKLPIFAAEAEMELSDLEAYRRVVLRRDA
jgi:tetraacyldisaccharide-1-P 4'-kinase